jgi:hypothetical protein
MECYGGGSIFGAIFGTVVVIAMLGVLAWWIYKKYYLKHQKGGLMTFLLLLLLTFRLLIKNIRSLACVSREEHR